MLCRASRSCLLCSDIAGPIYEWILIRHPSNRCTMTLEGVQMNLTTNLEGKVAWQKIVAAYARPSLPRSIRSEEHTSDSSH